jgi:hypothetical protein
MAGDTADPRTPVSVLPVRFSALADVPSDERAQVHTGHATGDGRDRTRDERSSAHRCTQRRSAPATTSTHIVRMIRRPGSHPGAPTEGEQHAITDCNDTMRLPSGLPDPVDDGAAANLCGARLPPVELPATSGRLVPVDRIWDPVVLSVFPMIANPPGPLPPGWDSTGARTGSSRPTSSTPPGLGPHSRGAGMHPRGARVQKPLGSVRRARGDGRWDQRPARRRTEGREGAPQPPLRAPERHRRSAASIALLADVRAAGDPILEGS